MNITPSYKSHIDSHKSGDNNANANTNANATLQIKDVSQLTPIPTAIKIKRPEPIKNSGECKQYEYPFDTILNTDFKNISSSYNKIAVCPFFVTTCENRRGVSIPYLQYILYKYPAQNTKVSNLLVFPFSNVTKKVNVVTEANKIMYKLINIKINPQGFLENNHTIYVFYNLCNVDDYFEQPRVEQQWLKRLKTEQTLWWVLIDEICNHRKSLNFDIHHSVTDLFYRNPVLIYLMNKSRRIDIPIVAYYGNYYKFLPIIASLGQKPNTWPNGHFGPYFYFTSYIGAFRYAGWTDNYKQRKVYGVQIADENGKIIKGGIIRFALFMDKTKVLLDMKDSKITDYMNLRDDKLTEHYQSLYLGRVPRINNSVWTMNPEFVVKDFAQQLPLSIHLVDMDSLKATWDPLYSGYQIE